MKRAVTLLSAIAAAALAGCDHERLDFGIESRQDAGTEQGEGRSESGSTEGIAAADGAPSEDGASAPGGAAGRVGGAAPDFNPMMVAGAEDGDREESEGLDELGRPRFDSDPLGWPTGDDEWGPECAGGVPEPELCGTAIDEDCDGQVDEHADIGASCVPTETRQGCGQERAFYVCETGTRNLVCVPLGCRNDDYDPEQCGNGFVDPGEQCDPMAPGEVPEQTCRPDCRKPLFERCIFSDGQRACPGGYSCNSWVAACMPQLGQHFARCPEIAIDREKPDGPFYPMVEITPEDDSSYAQCWISCTDGSQCPASLSHCYQGFCVVDF